jgi:hypothetical protein
MDLYEIILDATKGIAALDPQYSHASETFSQGLPGKGFREWNEADHRLRKAKIRTVDIGACSTPEDPHLWAPCLQLWIRMR